MIRLTRLNGTELMINSDLIETLEETPDTVITLSNAKVYIVRESVDEVSELVKEYKRAIFSNIFSRE